jgi:hypothetical protein
MMSSDSGINAARSLSASETAAGVPISNMIRRCVVTAA